MSSRAAILPAPGDPLLLRFWLKHFEKVWAKEVDTLYISLNTYAEPKIAEYLQELFHDVKEQAVFYIYENRQTDHGDSINTILDSVHEDLIMLIEDDSFILKPGRVSEMFAHLENDECDLIGSPRGSCSMEIWERSRELGWMSEITQPWGDTGPNFWPCFFFCRKADLLATDRNFNARSWQPGETIVPLDYVAQELCPSDTFVNTSLQLRKMGLRVAIQPQHHGHPNDLENYGKGEGLWAGVPWMHVGSLSSGVTGVLTDPEGRPLLRRSVDQPKDPGWELVNYANTEMEKLEWERRLAFWLIFWEDAEEDPTNPIPEFRALYKEAIDRVMYQYGLSPTRIHRMLLTYRELMPWL